MPTARERRLNGGGSIIARVPGPGGDIVATENLSTGVRVYREAGVEQSCVLPGGEAGVEYVRLMSALLLHGGSALLLGCGGGPISFGLRVGAAPAEGRPTLIS